MRIIIRIIINAVALWVAATLISGMNLTADFIGVLIVAILFGLVNAFIRPIVKLLSLSLTLITLGLFTLVINALMLLLTGWLSDGLSFEGTTIQVLFTALAGSIIISIVSTGLGWFLSDDD